MARFYVYEHWRPDLDLCFWVGKGNGDRAYRFKRNFHYNNVVKKLARLGMCVEVRMVQSGLNEPAALAIEIERIAFWRGVGVLLTNYTDGGEGVTGLRHSEATRLKLSIATSRNRLGKKHSPETIAKLRIAAKARGISKELRTKMGLAMRGRKHSQEHRQKISASNKGRAVSRKTRMKISRAHRGQKRSEESRKNMSLAHIGKQASAETRRKMSDAQTRRWALLKEQT